jgi:hypothetical protein
MTAVNSVLFWSILMLNQSSRKRRNVITNKATVQKFPITESRSAVANDCWSSICTVALYYTEQRLFKRANCFRYPNVPLGKRFSLIFVLGFSSALQTPLYKDKKVPIRVFKIFQGAS